MRRLLLTLLITLSFTGSHAQETQRRNLRYLEDQLYAGITYNVLLKKPEDVRQGGVSNGVQFGYMRDIPINKRRNIGFGVGAGWSVNTYFQNLAMVQDIEGKTETTVMLGSDYKKNRFAFNTIDIPIEFRYRTSTVDRFKFFRLYAGFMFSWMYRNHATLDNGSTKLRFYEFDEFNSWIYGPTLKIGYGSFNLNAFYAINPLFKDGFVVDNNNVSKDAGQSISSGTLNIGLVFYIL